MTHEFYRVQKTSQQETKLRFQTFAHHCLSKQIVHVLNFLCRNIARHNNRKLTCVTARISFN